MPTITPTTTVPQNNLEEAIRAGDCLAMLVEYYHANKQYQEAYQYLQVRILCVMYCMTFEVCWTICEK